MMREMDPRLLEFVLVYSQGIGHKAVAPISCFAGSEALMVKNCQYNNVNTTTKSVEVL
jgi:hypothetical protein